MICLLILSSLYIFQYDVIFHKHEEFKWYSLIRDSDSSMRFSALSNFTNILNCSKFNLCKSKLLNFIQSSSIFTNFNKVYFNLFLFSVFLYVFILLLFFIILLYYYSIYDYIVVFIIIILYSFFSLFF